MKGLLSFFGMFMAIVFVFSSCSREEDSLPVEEDRAYLSFQMSLSNLDNSENKQVTSNLPGCSPGIPAFVDVIITREGTVADPNATPIRLSLEPGGSAPFGDEASNTAGGRSESLELVPGTYFLQYFTVLDQDGNVIYLTPLNDDTPGGIDDLLDSTLPLEIDLSTGVYKTQDIGVICFDDRFVNQYGYLFYELNGIKIIEFCIFGNSCDATGRHEEFINYEVDVWKFSGDAYSPKGEILHEGLENEVVITDYEDYAEASSYPVCVTLPDGPGLDEYYIEIKRTNSGTNDGLIRSGLISDTDVKNLFNDDGTMEYYHFREGNCNLNDKPVLLSDHRDILGYVWEFTFIFGDALLSADVVFYPDGTAAYQLYGDPEDTVWGIWAYFDDYLFYDPDGEEEILDMNTVSGKYNAEEDTFSGKFWYNGWQDEWFAQKKIENIQ